MTKIVRIAFKIILQLSNSLYPPPPSALHNTPPINHTGSIRATEICIQFVWLSTAIAPPA